MTAAAPERLAWEISASRPFPAFFGAHCMPATDVERLMKPVMAPFFEQSALSFLDPDASLEYLDALLEDREPTTSSDVVFFEDALAGLSDEGRKKLNRGRELLRRLGRTLIFAESTAGSPESFDDLRDLLATFRDVIDLRPAASEDDHLWDTGKAFGLEMMSRSLPAVVTRGSIVIKAGVVHRKAAQQFRCPTCGEALKSGKVTVRFVYAPADTAEQSVPGYVCDCGEGWPDPQAIKRAYRAAFLA